MREDPEVVGRAVSKERGIVTTTEKKRKGKGREEGERENDKRISVRVQGDLRRNF